MAIVFMDGFDHYNMVDILGKWDYCYWTPSATNVLNTDAGLIDSLYANGTGQGLAINGSYAYIRKNLNADINTITIGFYFYLSYSSYAAGNFIMLLADGAEQCTLKTTATGALTMNRGTTVLATSTNTLVPRAWYHIEAKFTPHNTSGAYEVRINGTSTGWLSGSSVDLAATANNYANQVAIYGPGSSRTMYYDDIYILNDTAPNNDFLGPQKIITLFPSEAGTNADWTPNLYENFNNVNQIVPYPTGYSYNYSLTPGDIDSFKFQHAVSGTISGIAHNILTRQEIGTQKTLSHYMLINGTPVSGSPIISPSSTFMIAQKPLDRDPSNNAWTASNLDSAEFGYELES